MKKKILQAILLCTAISLFMGLLTLGTFAATQHRCKKGTYIPAYRVNGASLEIYCASCEAVQGTVSLSQPDGYVSAADMNLMIKESSSRLIKYVEKAGDTVLVVYQEKDGEPSEYDLHPMLGTDSEKTYYAYLTSRLAYDAYLEQKKAGEAATLPVLSEPVEFTVVHDCENFSGASMTVSGTHFAAICGGCGRYILPDVTLSVGLSEGEVCCGTGNSLPVNDNGWSELVGEEYIALYEGRGDTEYELTDRQPTALGDYSVSLALKDAWLKYPEEIEYYKTEPVGFALGTHDWIYSAGDRFLEAKCSRCGETAHAYLDASAILEACRNEDYNQSQQAVFYEDNWSNQLGILPYKVLYSEAEDLISEFGNKVNMIERPTDIGNYTVRLELTDGSGETMTTQEMPFYITGLPINQCKVLEYSDNSIKQFSKPKKKDGYYQVGTKSELLWCVYNQTDLMKISLTNDIVVNPITVYDDGSVSSAEEKIYLWRGFGAEIMFSGTIIGNGYTIYGLYVPDYNQYQASALICEAENEVIIKDLTIENSYLCNKYLAAAFVASLRCYAVGDGTEDNYIFLNCQSSHNYLTSDYAAGGIIGWLWSEKYEIASLNQKTRWLMFEGCVNRSSVVSLRSGGIIGATPDGGDDPPTGFTMKNCSNYGTISGEEYAAGIIGNLYMNPKESYQVINCLNAGYIKSENWESGIIGYIQGNWNSVEEGHYLLLGGNINIGELNSYTRKPVSDIISGADRNDLYSIGAIKIKSGLKSYYYASTRAYPSEFNMPEQTRLYTTDILEGTVCELLSGHRADTHFSDVTMATCQTPGSKSIKCLICETILETQTLQPHEHYVYEGKCLYCGTADSELPDTLGASIFSEASGAVIGVVILLLAAAGGTALLFKKKKEKAE